MHHVTAKPAAVAGMVSIHALMLFASLTVAGSFVASAAITERLDPGVLNLIRFVIAAGAMGLIVAFRYPIRWPGFGGLARYAAVAAPLVGFFWCLFEGLRTTTALNTSALLTTVPGMAAIAAAVLVKERLGWPKIGALLIGLFGALWVIFRGDPERVAALQISIGDGIYLAGCVSMAFYTPLARKLHRGEPAPVMTFWVLVTSLFWLLIASNVHLATTDWGGITLSTWGGIVYLALLPTVVTFFAYQYATLRIGPTRVVAYYYINPALVVLLEAALGYGFPSALTLPGVVIVIAASYVIQRGAATPAATLKTTWVKSPPLSRRASR
jgi:drug/metabolite transporter (DMT)-like permease